MSLRLIDDGYNLPMDVPVPPGAPDADNGYDHPATNHSAVTTEIIQELLAPGIAAGFSAHDLVALLRRDTQELFGYAPRSAQSDKAVMALDAALKDAAVGKDMKAIGAAIVEDGKVLLNSSSERDIRPVYENNRDGYFAKYLNPDTADAAARRAQNTYNKAVKDNVSGRKPATPEDLEHAQLDSTRKQFLSALTEHPANKSRLENGLAGNDDYLQRRLNEIFQGDRSVKRDSDGNVLFEFGSTGENGASCVEPKLYKQAGAQSADITSMSVLYRDDNNPYSTRFSPNSPRNEVIDENRVMDPCCTCRTNAPEITGEPTLGEFGENVKDGAVISGATTLVVSTVEALQSGSLTPDKIETIGLQTVEGTGVGALSTGIQEFSAKLVLKQALMNPEVTGGAAKMARWAIGSEAAGAGIAGAVVNMGFATYNEFQDGDLQNPATRSKAIGTIAGQGAVGLGAGLAGMAAGAAVGSIIPGAGTIVGGLIGFGVGMAASCLADQGLRAAGVDKDVASGVTTCIDVSAGAVNKVGHSASQATASVEHAAQGAVKDLVADGENLLQSEFSWA